MLQACELYHILRGFLENNGGRIGGIFRCDGLMEVVGESKIATHIWYRRFDWQTQDLFSLRFGHPSSPMHGSNDAHLLAIDALRLVI
jgi:hypothetical protein